MPTVLVLLLASCCVATAAASQQASRYVPAGHWTMPYVEHLIARGAMADPTPLTRPLKQADLLRALQAADSLTLTEGERRIVQRIMADLQRAEREPWVRLDGHLGVGAATHARRDPLREAGAGHATVAGGLALELLFGPVAVVTHPYFDTRLKYDPDWYGRKNRAIAGRNAQAYLSAQLRYAELFLGNLDRNWGPSPAQGILLSDSPYGMDHLGLMVGTLAVQLQAIGAQLNDLTDSMGATHHRYMVQHRLWVRLPGRWTIALWEASVISGVGRQLETWYLNIANLGLLTQLNTSTNQNAFVGVDIERRGRITVSGQAMLDDIQIDRTSPSDLKPTSYAFTVAAQGALRPGAGSWMAYYTQVSNLAFRNEDNFQVPLYFGLGTGRNFDDYDQLTGRLGFVTGSGMLLQPELTLLRQGEGDPRLPHPQVSAYASTRALFQGVVERTVRLAVRGRVDRGAWSVAGDGGVHFISNAGHVSGESDTRWVGSVGVTYRFRWESLVP